MHIYVHEAVTAGDLGADVPASLRREGEAMRNAVVADFKRVKGVTLECGGSTPLSFFSSSDAKEQKSKEKENGVEPPHSKVFVLVIAPEFDDLLFSCSQAVLAGGGSLLGSSPGAIRLTGDKLRTSTVWMERGVRSPQTDVDFAKLPPPWVLKPRYGAGSQATFLVRDHVERERIGPIAQKEWPQGEWIVQHYIEGQAASVAILMSPTQTIPLLPARQHLSRDGRFYYLGGSLPLPEPLASRATKIALQAVAGIDGLHGYVGVDLVLGEDGLDYAIEINPRLTTSYLGLRQLCQQNLAELMLRLAIGETIDAPTWHAGELAFDVPR